MILYQILQNVLTEFQNFDIGDHHIQSVIVYHNVKIAPHPAAAVT